MNHPIENRPWDPRLQKQRGDLLMGLVRQAARRFFNADGECIVSEVTEFDRDHKIIPHTPFYERERIQCALSLMTGSVEDVALGNRILSKMQFSSCAFTSMGLILMLIRHSEDVSSVNRQRILAHLARAVEDEPKPYNSFADGDNFPAMSCFILIVGGELLKNKDAVQAGIDTLYSARDLLTRRGFFSEYNSPTYAGVSLQALDETVNHARHPEALDLARKASERKWLDVAAHWHPGLSFQAGPYSRAYHNNSIIWSSGTNALVWIALGDVVFLNPVRTYFEEGAVSYEARVHTLPFYQAGCAGCAKTIHHIPDYIGQLFLAKTFPFRVSGTAETSTYHYGDYRRTKDDACIHIPGASADYGANPVFASTYMEEDFAIGAATRGFASGAQSDIFHEMHKLRPQASSWADVRSVFVRFLTNETKPEDEASKTLLTQEGNGFAIQDDRRALALYYPNGARRAGIHSLKLSLVAQEITSPVDEIWIGDRRLPNGDGESAQLDWVILRDGPMLLAFYPLPTTNLGRRVAIRSARENNYRVISFYNYEGPPRDFAAHDLQIVQNGFIFEASTLREHDGVPAFLADLREGEVCDHTALEVRRVRYLREGRELFLCMDPALQTIKTQAVNGKEVGGIPLTVDGVDLAQVPWIGAAGVLHKNLFWWKRIAARKGIPNHEALSGRCVDK